MSLPKKGSRTITVDDFIYRWMASGNDGWIDLYIELGHENGQPLKAKFDYHQEKTQKNDGVSLKQTFIVTPDIVRQTIQIGKREGWSPSKIGKPFDLQYIDDKINWKKTKN